MIFLEMMISITKKENLDIAKLMKLVQKNQALKKKIYLKLESILNKNLNLLRKLFMV